MNILYNVYFILYNVLDKTSNLFSKYLKILFKNHPQNHTHTHTWITQFSAKKRPSRAQLPYFKDEKTEV